MESVVRELHADLSPPGTPCMTSAFQIDPSGQKPAMQAAIDREKCIAQSKPSIAHGFIGQEQIRTQALEADES